jgi:hypothetical protein
MNNLNLIQQYQSKSDIELLFTANNYDKGYTSDAIEAAKYVLKFRHNTDIIPEKAWHAEIQRLKDLDIKCCLCSSDDVEYKEKIFFCAEENLNIGKSVPGVIALLAFGIGYTSHNYQYVEAEFKLCSRCIANHKNKSENVAIPKIEWEEYYKHPLYELYRLFGFNEIRA